MELVRLRVKEIDFQNGLLFVRDGKGEKDRTTLLPKGLHEELKSHLKTVKTIHERDLAAGLGDVYLPHALDRKYPNAGKSWGWQYVFPADHVALDPRSGKYRRHHITSKTIQRAVKKTVAAAGIDKPASVHTLRHLPHTCLCRESISAFVRLPASLDYAGTRRRGRQNETQR